MKHLQINNIIDVRKYMAKLGYIIYTGDQAGDLEFMKEEILELYQTDVIDKDVFTRLMNQIIKEERKVQSGK